MPRFTVDVKEIWTQSVDVEADTIEEALEKAKDLSSDSCGNFEYSHTLDKETWNVYNEDGDIVK